MIKTIVHIIYSFLMSFPFATVAMVLTPLKNLLEVQSTFFSILAVAIIIDLLIGAIKYLKLNKFSFRKLVIGLIVKVAVAYGGMLFFIFFASLEEGWASEWFLLIGKFTILLYPAGSAFTNMYVITGGKFPPIGFMKKMELFDQLSVPLIPTIEENINATKNK